jgi:hypothetical protein
MNLGRLLGRLELPHSVVIIGVPASFWAGTPSRLILLAVVGKVLQPSPFRWHQIGSDKPESPAAQLSL